MSTPPRGLSNADLRLLEPKCVRLSRDAFGALRLEIGIEERYEPVRVLRALPLTDPNRFISFTDDEGAEIGILEDPSRLDPESRKILEEEIQLVYLRAEVRSIVKVNPRVGLVSWELDTSLGPRTIYLKDRHDIRPLPDGRIILTDVHGAKYEIPSLDALDDRSRAWLEIEM